MTKSFAPIASHPSAGSQRYADAFRPIARRNGALPRVVWRITTSPKRDSIALLRGCNQRCALIAEDLSPDALATLPPDFAMLLEITPDTLRSRRAAGVIERLHALGRGRCLGVILTGVETVDLKAGWPTHRFQTLRDAGITSTLLIDCPDAATAAWAAAHSTAAGVIARYDEADQSLAHVAFAEAAEAEAAVLATSPSLSARDLSFRTGDPRVAAAVVDLPDDPETLATLQHAARTSLSIVERADTWSHYVSVHPAPVRSRRTGEPLDA